MTWQTVKKAKNKPNLNFAKPQRPRNWQHHTQPLWGRGSEEDRLCQFSRPAPHPRPASPSLQSEGSEAQQKARGRTETQLKEEKLRGAQDLQDFSFLTSLSLPGALADKPFHLATEDPPDRELTQLKGNTKTSRTPANQPSQVTIQRDQ